MLYIYDKDSKSLKACQETVFKDHGLLERQHLEHWVETNPEMLGEDLMVITTEYDGFDKTNERLDVLALDRDGNLVVVELKRDDSGRTVDLQAVKYAAYCSTLRLADIVTMHVAYAQHLGEAITEEQASQRIIGFITAVGFEELNKRPRIMLVARDFRSEVTASVLWLRTFDIDISCIKWDPFVLSEGSIALSTSVLIPLPEAKDFLMRAERKDSGDQGMSLTQAEYVKFFSSCSEALAKLLPRNYPFPSPRAYYQIPTGIRGIHYEWGFHGRPRSTFGVELHFESSDRDRNRAQLEACMASKDKLEAALGQTVSFEPEWTTRMSRLYVEKQQGQIDDTLVDWAVSKMHELITLMDPIVATMDTL